MAKKEPRRDCDIHVKMTRGDMTKLKQLARHAGLPLATWARVRLLEIAKILD